MDYVIIGNGAAGTTAAARIRELDLAGNIILLSREPHPYYARPRLPDMIAGKVAPEKLVIYPEAWYEKNRIELRLGVVAESVDPQQKLLRLAGGDTLGYDKLLLAVGSDPFMPPIENIGACDCVFVLRTLEDAEKIMQIASREGDVIGVGGGLLGLEVLSSLANEKRVITVVEACPSLLPCQLQAEQGARLQAKLEERGFVFHLAAQCNKVTEAEGVVSVSLSDGTILQGSMLIVTAGVVARTALAANAGVAVERGIKVDPFLKTNIEDIYAAGDCIQLGDRLWGFVKSSMDQGRVAGENMVLGESAKYTGSEIAVKLKVSGIDLAQL